MMNEERAPEASFPSGPDRLIPYTGDPDAWIEVEGERIAHFAYDDSANLDAVTVASFGREWKKFNTFTEKEIAKSGDEYFDVVDEKDFSPETVALDLGCGSGRWSRYLAPKVGFIEAIDPSEAVVAAQALTGDLDNVRVTRAGVNSLPFADHSFDFIFSLGVLHHLPDTGAALSTATRKLKPGGMFLLYLYYALDNRGPGYKLLFHISNLARRVIFEAPGEVEGVGLRGHCTGVVRSPGGTRPNGEDRLGRETVREGSPPLLRGQVLVDNAQRRPRSVRNAVGETIHQRVHLRHDEERRTR